MFGSRGSYSSTSKHLRRDVGPGRAVPPPPSGPALTVPIVLIVEMAFHRVPAGFFYVAWQRNRFICRYTNGTLSPLLMHRNGDRALAVFGAVAE